MECGIVGFPGVGKTTLFEALTAHSVKIQPGTLNANLGQADIPDPRLHEIARHITTQEIIPARIHLVDIPGIPRGSGSGYAAVLANIRNVDALCHVVDCFSEEANPVSALADLELELILADLALVESALEKAHKAAGSGDKEAAARRDALEKTQAVLESERPVRSAEWSDEEVAALRGYGLLSSKPQLVVANINESDLDGSGVVLADLRAAVADAGGVLVALSANLESEIAELPAEERDEMLRSMGLVEPAIGPLARAINELLGLATFYTAGEKEVRAWPIRQGAAAPEAAGVIHTDIEHGFIRAECYHVDELSELGSEKAIKEAGKLRSEGKQYVMQDGDVVHFLFNV
jgi:GTP-binding protein YchF